MAEPRCLEIDGDIGSDSSSRCVAVGGPVAATSGAAVVVLDPDPPPLSVPPMPNVLPLSYPTLLGGLEVLGAVTLRVDGAEFVNTQWGGFDENGDLAGTGYGPPYAVSATLPCCAHPFDGRSAARSTRSGDT